MSATRDKQLAFLTQPPHSNDQKLAVMTALGFEHGDNAALFVQLLERLRPGDVSASDRFVAGYLLALDDYLKLKMKGLDGRTALELLDQAAAELPDDFAVQYARALVQAQAAMDSSWCDVYRLPEAVKQRFPKPKRNLRPAALEAADGYLHGYSESCEGSQEAQHKKRAELNQLYTVSGLGRQVVAGAQGGVVVWEPEALSPVAKREGFICRGLSHQGAVWVGCEAELVRWDGKAFKPYLRRAAKSSAEYYQPMRGPEGALWVRLGKRAWRYDASTDRFQQVTPPWRGAPYDALTRKNGETWWVDFLKAVVVDGRALALKSPAYPGSDPRRLREDDAGTLWVEDFESGLFRYDDERGSFVQVPGLDAKASGVAYDAARQRLILLHYTDGLVAGETKVRLPELQYMRDLMLDERGDLWVAGWTGLMRLRPDGASFGRQLFEVK